MSIKLSGNWKSGHALDLHTLRSEYAGENEYGHARFNTTRTEIGQLVYTLKYRNDEDAVSQLVKKIKATIRGINHFDYMIPIPPSNKNRPKQPVLLVARALSAEFGVKVLADALDKNTGATEIKNVRDSNERVRLLQGAMFLNKKYDLSHKKVLLIDDLYRSGATLRVATALLYEQAHAETVCVLTLTKTRSTR